MNFCLPEIPLTISTLQYFNPLTITLKVWNIFGSSSMSLMSLDVKQMVAKGKLEHAEWVLCGACVDTCPEKSMTLSIGKG